MLPRLAPPLDIQGLNRQRTSPPGGYRVFPDFLYDTVNYPAAGVPAQGTLQFFSASANIGDLTLTNLTQPGTLPSPHIFHAQFVTIKPIVETFVAGAGVIDASGVTRDLDRIFTTSRSFLQYSNSANQQQQGNIPLNALGQVGGIVPTFGGNNAPAAGNNAVYQSPRLSAHGGFPLDIILLPLEKINFGILFGVQQAITAITPLRIELYGWHYIPVGQG